MEKVIIIKYAELSTKSDNINFFIKTLKHNIESLLQKETFSISSDVGRMIIYTENIPKVMEKLKTVFGIHEIMIGYIFKEKDLDTIKENVLFLIKDKEFNTFRVTTKRSDKHYEIPSVEVSKFVGAHILKNIPNKKVDVHNPDYLLHIEIRKDYTYIYHKEIKASGGYPVSVAGRGLLMLSGGIDSPVAGYLAMKRGIKIECVYFESPPHTSVMAKNKVKKLVEELTKYDSSITLNVVKFTALQEAIYKNIDPTYMITIMRRMMYRISEKIMEKTSCLCLINGESVGQVASQTLTSMRVINSVTNVPVIRPVACLDKLEIIDISRKIGTYETSILPYEDCCTIFLPKHPVINPNMDKAILYEKSFDFNSLIDEAVNSREVIEIKRNNTKFDI